MSSPTRGNNLFKTKVKLYLVRLNHGIPNLSSRCNNPSCSNANNKSLLF